MTKACAIILVSFAIFSLLCSPLHAADFAPIFPKQAAPVVASPTFTWAAGDYDLFVLYLLLPIPISGYWYTPIPVPRYLRPYWRCPDALWDYLPMDGWCLWLVLGINTTTYAYEVAPWQYFQKVSDCVVSFPDLGLEGIIRGKIGKPFGEIKASELEGITEIIEYSPTIADLNGLEYCANLEVLDLQESGLGTGDLSPLAGLVSLNRLRVRSDSISDLSPLSGLVNLTELMVGYIQVADLTPLSTLSGLESLSLSSNDLSDLSPLASLLNLVELSLSGSELSDIAPLSGLVNLRTLDLSFSPISDIAPLATLVALETLWLYYDDIPDITPLNGLVNLETLYLGGNQISDISPLAPLGNLVTLELSGNMVSDISPLAGLSNLAELNLPWNMISDLSPLAGLTGLSSLSLSFNEITDLTPLSSLVGLSHLTLHENQIEDILALVQNFGIGSGDIVTITSNPLSPISCTEYIPILQGRGAHVNHSCPKNNSR